MDNQLQLVTSQNFGTVKCDFWQTDDKNEFWMTRDQIGMALEYDNPMIAIAKIHDRHKNRLDKFSVLTKLGNTRDRKYYDTYIYSSKGVYEICRWSRQEKADTFMDWVWNIIDGLRTGEYTLSQNNMTLSPQLIDAIISQYIAPLESRIISHFDDKFNMIGNSYLYLQKLIEQNAKSLVVINPVWKDEMYKLADRIVKQNPCIYENSKAVLKAIYIKMRNVYGIVWEQEQKEFKETHNITGRVKTMELISSKEELKSLFSVIMNGMLDDKENTKNSSNKLNNIKDIIAPLIEKRNDKTLGGNRTYQLVYSRMGVSWTHRLSRYRNIHKVKNNPPKSKLIMDDPKMLKMFKDVVNKMLQEI